MNSNQSRSLSEISIRNPVFAWMLMIALMLFGSISLARLGVSQMPDIDYPTLSINFRLDGASPYVMESDVIDTVEDALSGLEGIREISSTARQGSADITLDLNLDRNIDVAVQEIQSVLTGLQRLLPRDLEPPVIRKSNPEDNPILWLAVTYSGDLRELMTYVRYTLKDRFQSIPGVGDIVLGGYVDRTMQINISSEKLARLELTIGDVANTVTSGHVELPSGRQDLPKEEIALRTTGETISEKEIAQLPISSRGGMTVYNTIRIMDVAEVKDFLADQRRISRFKGKTAVGLGIRKQRGANSVKIAQTVKNQLAEIKKEMKPGFDINVTFDSTLFIEEAIHELEITLIISILLTALVLKLFLGGWQSTINVLLSIPTSILGTFICIHAFGFTLNTFTLLALTLATGIVVDDAIMVLENISRHREMGKSALSAALEGATQITFAAMAATFSIVAIFLPVAYMQGEIGRYFYQFGVTMSVAIVLSLVEALTLTPMRASFIQKRKKSSEFQKDKMPHWLEVSFTRLANFYRRTLALAFQHSNKVLWGSLAFFVVSLVLIKFIKTEFVPAQDQSRLMIRIKTPPGSSLAYTDSATQKIEAYLAQQNYIERYFAAVGGIGGGNTSFSQVMVTLKPKNERAPHKEIMKTWRKELAKIDPAIKVGVQDLSLNIFSSGRGFPVEFSIDGPDWEKLADISEAILVEMRKSPLIADADSNLLAGQTEIHLVPDRAAANLRGVNIAEIANTVSGLYGGRVVGKFTEGGHRYDIRVRLSDVDRNNENSFRRIYVRNNRGELVPLMSVVKLVKKRSLQQIYRVDRQRSVQFQSNTASHASPTDALDAARNIASKHIVDGYSLKIQGSSKTQSSSFNNLWMALILGVVVAYMILGSQFNSFIHPITILIALPFSFSGALIALLLTGQTLNVFSFIGIILLMGLVKKNSILIVEFAVELRRAGQNAIEAAKVASEIRFRPIMMTTITTIVGAIPSVLALGPGAETRVPMAVAILGGLSISTLLTLYVVPIAFVKMARFERDGTK